MLLDCEIAAFVRDEEAEAPIWFAEAETKVGGFWGLPGIDDIDTPTIVGAVWCLDGWKNDPNSP